MLDVRIAILAAVSDDEGVASPTIWINETAVQRPAPPVPMPAPAPALTPTPICRPGICRPCAQDQSLGTTDSIPSDQIEIGNLKKKAGRN